MAGPVIARQGCVVETGTGPVVRFAPGCGAEGVCACNGYRGPDRHLDAAAIGVASQALPGRPVTLLVERAALTRVALRLFAVPVAALLTGAWTGSALATRLGWPSDLPAALFGLGALAVTFALVARNGGALLRTLNLRARVD